MKIDKTDDTEDLILSESRMRKRFLQANKIKCFHSLWRRRLSGEILFRRLFRVKDAVSG